MGSRKAGFVVKMATLDRAPARNKFVTLPSLPHDTFRSIRSTHEQDHDC
jgi:hypothetical protein